MEMDWKELAVVFFYNNIKAMAQQFLGGLGIPVDYILAFIGYWKRDTWWGKGLLYGAVASLGSTMGGMIFRGLPFVGAPAPSQAQATTQTKAEVEVP